MLFRSPLLQGARIPTPAAGVDVCHGWPCSPLTPCVHASPGQVRVGEMHISSRTMSVHVELRLDTAKAIHALEFDDAGLITSSELYSELPTIIAPQMTREQRSSGKPSAGGSQPPSG